jgi:hypothetical protein
MLCATNADSSNSIKTRGRIIQKILAFKTPGLAASFTFKDHTLFLLLFSHNRNRNGADPLFINFNTTRNDDKSPGRKGGLSFLSLTAKDVCLLYKKNVRVNNQPPLNEQAYQSTLDRIITDCTNRLAAPPDSGLDSLPQRVIFPRSYPQEQEINDDDDDFGLLDDDLIAALDKVEATQQGNEWSDDESLDLEGYETPIKPKTKDTAASGVRFAYLAQLTDEYGCDLR